MAAIISILKKVRGFSGKEWVASIPEIPSIELFTWNPEYALWNSALDYIQVDRGRWIVDLIDKFDRNIFMDNPQFFCSEAYCVEIIGDMVFVKSYWHLKETAFVKIETFCMAISHASSMAYDGFFGDGFDATFYQKPYYERSDFSQFDEITCFRKDNSDW